MPAIRVRFQQGVFIPEEPVDVPEGQVGVVMLAPPSREKTEDASDEAWLELMLVVERCGLRTGIADLAQHHDHYLYGTPCDEASQ